MSGFGRIIATVNVKDPWTAASEAEAAIAAGADRAEIRIDALSAPRACEDLLGLAGKIPLLFSGNRAGLSPAEAVILREASAWGAWIDVPFVEGLDIPRWADRSRTVLSFHGIIADRVHAAGILSSMKGRAALVKLVPPAGSISEAARFLSWMKGLREICPLIAFPSGNESVAARILALSRGSESVYAASGGSEPAAAGQIRLSELLSYRPARITENTTLYGLLGHPLQFSLSPGLWNGWFEELGMDARYLLFPASDISNALEAFTLLGISGFGVTAPHKEGIIPSMGRLSNLSARCRAVNTVILGRGASLGTNTDVFGIRRSLGFLKRGSHVLVLGNGGAARAAVFALRRSHRVVVSARSPDKGRALAEEMGVAFAGWDLRRELAYDLMINATSCGSDGKTNPWDEGIPLPAASIMDMVTSDKETPLEKKARDEGLAVVSGREMLCGQARLQFRILTGIKPPKGCSLFNDGLV